MQCTPKSGQSIKFSSYPDLSKVTPDQDIIQNINIRKRKNPEQETLTDLKEQLMESFKQMMNTEIGEIKQQNSQILESNSQIIKLLEQNAENYKEIAGRVQNLETKYEAENIRVTNLELQLNELQKQLIKNTVEIRNIPRDDKENVYEIVNNIYNTLSLPPIDATTNIYRRGKFDGPIVVEYKEDKKKETIIKAAKKYNSENRERPLNTELLGFSGIFSRVYVSEALTPLSKKMLAAARELVKSGRYKYCWVSRGNILLRKEEGQSAIVIKTLNQIKALATQ